MVLGSVEEVVIHVYCSHSSTSPTERRWYSDSMVGIGMLCCVCYNGFNFKRDTSVDSMLGEFLGNKCETWILE